MLTLKNDYSAMYNTAVTLTADYIKSNGIKSLVLGLSGGIDSAVTAALAYTVCRKLNIPLFGRSMPILSNELDEISRSAHVGEVFCSKGCFEETRVPEAMYQMAYGLLASTERQEDVSLPEKIRRGNIKARMRMITLYDLAHLNKGMVLSTDNYTELMLGFWTICGDVGDWGMIQNLWKTEVYGLALWIAKNKCDRVPEQADALLRCIKAVPTDGLGVTTSDFDQLGINSYSDIDDILIKYLTTGACAVGCPVIKRHLASQFKRDIPITIPRRLLVDGLI